MFNVIIVAAAATKPVFLVVKPKEKENIQSSDWFVLFQLYTRIVQLINFDCCCCCCSYYTHSHTQLELRNYETTHNSIHTITLNSCIYAAKCIQRWINVRFLICSHGSEKCFECEFIHVDMAVKCGEHRKMQNKKAASERVASVSNRLFAYNAFFFIHSQFQFGYWRFTLANVLVS